MDVLSNYIRVMNEESGLAPQELHSKRLAEQLQGNQMTLSIHTLDEQWLRSRVRGWMQIESQGCDFFIGAINREGGWIYCSSQNDSWRPSKDKVDYAVAVCLHLNINCSEGGAWLAGWIENTFYLLFKDSDGDIQIPIECDKPWIVIREWGPDVWEKHAATAIMVWQRHHQNIEYGLGQQKKVAQGELLH